MVLRGMLKVIKINNDNDNNNNKGSTNNSNNQDLKKNNEPKAQYKSTRDVKLLSSTSCVPFLVII